MGLELPAQALTAIDGWQGRQRRFPDLPGTSLVIRAIRDYFNSDIMTFCSTPTMCTNKLVSSWRM
jgi:hypothetical protein